jgi:ABC-2 type transport system permease protein
VRKLFVVVKREYLTRVRTKGFIIGTVLMPILVLLFGLGPSLLMMLETGKRERVAVIDLTGLVFPEMQALTQDSVRWGGRVELIQAKPEGGVGELKRELSQRVDQDKLDAYIFIPADVFESLQVEYYARNVSDFKRLTRSERLLSEAVRRVRLARSGLDAELVQGLMRGVEMRTFRVGPEGKEEADSGGMFFLTFVLGLFLYMTLIIYGTFVMRSVIEEKSSRVVEVVVSSLRPFDLMAGKIVGVGAVGLTQFAVWIAALVLVSAYGSAMVTGMLGQAGEIPIPSVPISTYVYFAIFFLLGYFLYATMYAGVGALVNSDQEAQNLQFPVILLLVLSFMLMFFVISNPDSSAARILSLIPFFAPILMFTRIVVQAPPAFEIWGSILFLAASIVGMIWLVGKIYRVGILMYGKRPTFPEVMKWLRFS